MTFFKENRKIFLKILFGLLCIGLALFFIRKEKTEIHDVSMIMSNAKPAWILLGIIISLLYINLQGLMYFFSFRSVNKNVGLISAIQVYLKRNFISVFLPAGGVASLAFFTKEFELQNISKTKIHFASSIYAFTGILTVMIIAIPAMVWAVLQNDLSANQFFAFIIVAIFVGTLVILFYSVIRQSMLYPFIIKIFPRVESFLTEMRSIAMDKKSFFFTICCSLMIEITGIVHLLVASHALGFQITLENAVMAYITSVLFLMISPFLRGLGAVELAMTYILTRFGFSTVDAISITLIYRFFEFWLILLFGGLSFLFIRNNLVLRVIPAVLTFFLGIVNIISVLTPAIQSRVNAVLEFLPLYAVHVSNYFVLTAGLFLLVISAFLLKGLKTTWYIALSLTLFSLVGHLTKAIDYEEAFLAGIAFLALVMTRHQYFVKSHPKWEQIGILTALASMGAVIIYGTVGFYFLDKKYFNIDFNLLQSVKYSLQNFFMIRGDDLQTTHKFGTDFLLSIRIAGFLSLSFLLYTLVRPYVLKPKTDDAEKDKAVELVKRFGKSGLDYFKTYQDKLYFFGENGSGFLSFRIAGTYAAVLENPVCPDEKAMRSVILAFDRFCLDNGLRSFYYRVPEQSISTYESIGKKTLIIGQEAIIDLKMFTLDGGSKKSIRNACNKALENGYFARIHTPPVKEGLLQKIKAVSDDWLDETEFREMAFAQGYFDIKQLRRETLITIENHEEKVVAFLNLIPDYAPGEVTFDLIRRSGDAPNGIVDFLLVETIRYLASRGYRSLNLGFAPMSGIEKGRDFPEKSLKFAYEKIRTFSSFKGLRDFKDKFGPEWNNSYLVYDHHYDLFNIPSILTKVFKP